MTDGIGARLIAEACKPRRINVRIKRVRDGAEVTWSTDDDGDSWSPGEFNDYQWTEGNFCCDCNRSILFDRATGVETEEAPCGEVAYRILWIKDDAGRVLLQGPT